MQTQNSRKGEALNLLALTEYLRQSELGIRTLDHCEQFKSGFSNLTYLLHTDKGLFVLRRPPFGPKAVKAHDMVREYKLLNALTTVFAKAPRPYLMCDDDTVLGAPFYLMENVEGEIIRAQPGNQTLLPESTRAAASSALIQTLADLHQLDLSSSPLRHLGKPEGYVERQVEGWIERFARAKTDNVSIPQGLTAYLRSEQITDHAGRLVHNDFKFDNIVFKANDYNQVAAVLDWEMSTIGHPILDLGLTLAYWAHPEEVKQMPFLGINATHLPGCWRRNQLVSAYAKTSIVPPDRLLYGYVFGNFKIAGIVQQIYARYASGHTKDPRFAKLDHVANFLLKRAQVAITVGSIE